MESFAQQFVSYSANKSSGEVLSVSPINKLERINKSKRDEGTNDLHLAIKDDNESKNENSDVGYTISENKNYKYNTHIEGRIKDCKTQLPIPHAFVSLHNKIQNETFILVSTNREGFFSVDVTDDYVGGISLIKKGYVEKSISLVNVNNIDTKKLYSVSNSCLIAAN